VTEPIAETDSRLSFIPVDAESPEGEVIHRKNRWWIVHPEKGLLIWRGFSAQCNSDKRIAESLRDRLYPWAEVRFIPSVFTREAEERNG